MKKASEMTDDDLNRLIAEDQGWHKVDGYSHLMHKEPKGYYSLHDIGYCQDLNAMHEAIMSITDQHLKADFARILKQICWASDQPEFTPINACARQRAEAYAITKKLAL